MTKEEKALEDRLRRTALRRGLRLRKSRRRAATDLGGYMLIDPNAKPVILGAAPADYSASLEEVAEHFDRGPGG